MPETKIDHLAILTEAVEEEGSLGPQYSYFRDLSIGNQAYLYMQGAREIVGKFIDWPKVGRHVIAKSKAYEIIRPIFYRRETDDPDEEEVLRTFKPVRCMFTLSQTEGEDVPPIQVPDWDVMQMLGAMGMHLVEFDSMNGNLQGYSRGLEIAVSPIAANRLKTIIHEAGHIALGHTLGHSYEEYHAPRGVMEFQAEGAAYLVLKMLGVMDEETARNSRGYMQHWLHHEKPPERAARQVLTVADRIWRVGRVAKAIGEIALIEPEE